MTNDLNYRVCFQLNGKAKWYDIGWQATLDAAQCSANKAKAAVAKSFNVTDDKVRMVIKSKTNRVLEEI